MLPRGPGLAVDQLWLATKDSGVRWDVPGQIVWLEPSAHFSLRRLERKRRGTCELEDRRRDRVGRRRRELLEARGL